MAFDDMTVGQTASIERVVSENDVVLFADITGDRNPVHLDADVAAASRFGGRIAHGMLTASCVSAVLGMKLPGPGTVYLEQSLRFVRPVPLGETITAEVEVLELFPGKRRVRLATRCRNGAGELVLDGVATVLVLDS
ncbi:MAG TPA: MaoC family dehydratase [Longimicrobiales bacterium]|nr:MaoC family dehydratase [Longimicrobiales bacterium]